MEGMFSISQKAVAHVRSVYCAAPRVGLRLGDLHKSCRDHCPWKTCSVCCLLLAGVTCNNRQILGAIAAPSVPRQELHHHPCVTAALLHDPPGFPPLSPSAGKQGRLHSNSKEGPSDPSCIWYCPSFPVCYACPWIQQGWLVQRERGGCCAWPRKSELH